MSFEFQEKCRKNYFINFVYDKSGLVCEKPTHAEALGVWSQTIKIEMFVEMNSNREKRLHVFDQ